MAKAVVIGAGPNGLIAAARLARQGWSTTLIERRAEVGGLAASGGFAATHRHGGWLPHTAWLSPEVDGLAGVGRRRGPALMGVHSNGSAFRLDEDPGWRAWCAWADRYRSFARSLLDAPAPRLRSDGSPWEVAKAAIGFRRLGRGPMMDLLRVAPLSMEDALVEHIADPAVRAVAAGPALLGSWMGPLSPTGAALLLLDRALREHEVVGGGPALVAGLSAAAAAAGVEIHTSCAATRIDPAARTVTLEDGNVLAWDVLVAACDPRTALLELVPAQQLPVRAEYQAQEHRVRGLVAVVHLALREAPSVGGDAVRLLHTATHPLEIERAFDAGKRGKLPHAAPVLLRADPDGRSATAWVHGVPLGDEIATPEGRSAVLEQVLAALTRVWPGCRDAVEAHQVWTPTDLALEHGLAGGHLWHGEHALDQLWSMRPGLDLSGLATPIDGLFLGSGGCHPAGGITGRPGWRVADQIGAPGDR